MTIINAIKILKEAEDHIRMNLEVGDKGDSLDFVAVIEDDLKDAINTVVSFIERDFGDKIRIIENIKEEINALPQRDTLIRSQDYSAILKCAAKYQSTLLNKEDW